VDDHQHRRGTDRWNIFDFAIPAGAFCLLLLSATFIWLIGSTLEEQSRIRHEHSRLLQKVVDACRRPLQ
jgi:hypothetical protein